MGAAFANKAFAAFTVALAASVWALFADIGRPFLPSVPIVVYALYLYGNRDAVAQLGSDTLKDSPYFLGFLLTMFGLFKVFNDVSFNFALFGRNPALMTQEVGGAVMSTIVGLFCRQALLSLVPDAPAEEDDRLAALAAAVTSHAVAFEAARQQFFREMADESAQRAQRLEATQQRLLDEMARGGKDRGGGPSGSAPAGSSPAPATPTTSGPTPSQARPFFVPNLRDGADAHAWDWPESERPVAPAVGPAPWPDAVDELTLEAAATASGDLARRMAHRLPPVERSIEAASLDAAATLATVGPVPVRLEATAPPAPAPPPHVLTAPGPVLPPRSGPHETRSATPPRPAPDGSAGPRSAPRRRSGPLGPATGFTTGAGSSLPRQGGLRATRPFVPDAAGWRVVERDTRA